ncbi:MAG: tRNA (adenosine(37)-N6)-dimethylallyltransferase MiaA [Cytophagales bacterium]|nr:MAG: tRNA (adenosine(37)-N6)-dimethylallyltransferase MiaA [Cytophagales bacterium]
MKKKLIIILGPTAVGKTDAAIKLATDLKTDIISADSRQFYKEMSIGTAKPTETQLATVKHYFINNLSINDDYSCGDFEREVIDKLTLLFEKNDSVVMVGGSGLFLKAVCEGIDEMPPEDKELRAKLNLQFQTEGLSNLLLQLKNLDPDYFNQIDHHNSQRIIRALEVCISTQKPYSSFRTGKIIKRDFEIIKIGLMLDRALLYKRINERVDIMLENGLENEAKFLYPYKNINALQTVGYQEFFDYFDDKITKEKAIDSIKQNTRRFAKRQMTWFNKDKEIHWMHPEDAEQIFNYGNS